MKLIDCFIFYNELDLLKVRLNELKDVVDYFIVVEATTTFRGAPKQLFYQDHKNLFHEYEDKIIHIISDTATVQGTAWERESTQRRAIGKGVEQLLVTNRISESDLLAISDVDEILDSETLHTLKKKLPFDGIHSLEQDFYYYNLTCQSVSKWYAAKLLTVDTFQKFQNDAQLIRSAAVDSNKIVKRGGWHLSYFGNVSFIINKIKAFSHQEYDTAEFTDAEKIQSCIERCSDLFRREQSSQISVRFQYVSIFENNYLPNSLSLIQSLFPFDTKPKKLRFQYGSDSISIDVTGQATDLFVKNDLITIPKRISFNHCFGDVHPNVAKNLVIVNEFNGSKTQLSEERESEYVAFVSKATPLCKMTLNLERYSYTQTWFENLGIQTDLLNHVARNARNNILEIGSHEGLSACCFSDNLLSHPQSSLDCVDPFSPDDPTTPVTSETELFFKRNIGKSNEAKKCTLHKAFSNDFFAKNKNMFNIIYIDGSHLPLDIENDMKNSFHFLQVNGIMWMDDYASSDIVKNCMDNVVKSFGDKVEIIHTSWQLGLRKIK